MKRILFFIFVVCASSTLFAQFNIDSGLIVSYHFDQNTTDASGNGYDATNHGCTYANDLWGTPNAALYFNGTSAYLELPNAARFQPLSSHTMSFWIKTQQASRFDLVDQRTGSGSPSGFNYGIYFNVPTIPHQFLAPHYNPNVNNTDLELHPPNLFNNQWHHLAFVKDCEHDTMYFYYNNVVCDKKYFQDVTYTVSGTLKIGNSYDMMDYFQGYIDEVRIYNWALSADNVNYLGLADDINVIENSVNVFPNPSGGRFTLISSVSFKSNVNYQIFDIAGQLIQSGFIPSDKQEFSKEILLDASGIYYMTFYPNGVSSIRKLVVVK